MSVTGGAISVAVSSAQKTVYGAFSIACACCLRLFDSPPHVSLLGKCYPVRISCTYAGLGGHVWAQGQCQKHFIVFGTRLGLLPGRF